MLLTTIPDVEAGRYKNNVNGNQLAGTYLIDGTAVDTFHIRDGTYPQIEGCAGNDILNVTGQDTLITGTDTLFSGGASESTLVGNAGNDLILIGLDPDATLSAPRHGSLAGLGGLLLWYGDEVDGISDTLGGHTDSIEVYDDANATNESQHTRLRSISSPRRMEPTPSGASSIWMTPVIAWKI